MCTISWLNSLIRPQVMGKKYKTHRRIQRALEWFILAPLVLLVFLFPISASAEENTILSFMNAEGKVVFTNVVENTAAPAAGATHVARMIPVAETTKVLAEETPAQFRALVD